MTPRYPLLLPVLLLVVMLFALPFWGCGDDDDPMKPEDPVVPYPSLSTPQNVLAAYEIAYSRRDTVMVGDLFDSTYSGESMDLNGSGTLTFNHADEVAHVRALATTPGLMASLDLGAPPVWDVLPSDDPSHPEWSMIQISGSTEYRIEIFDGLNALGAVGAAGTFLEFAFAPTLDSSSPTDTLWKIVRWKETGRSDAPPPLMNHPPTGFASSP